MDSHWYFCPLKLMAWLAPANQLWLTKIQTAFAVKRGGKGGAIDSWSGMVPFWLNHADVFNAFSATNNGLVHLSCRSPERWQWRAGSPALCPFLCPHQKQQSTIPKHIK